MIFALSGPLCSGKETAAQYLKDRFNFTLIDMRKELRRQDGFEGSEFDLELAYSSGRDSILRPRKSLISSM